MCGIAGILSSDFVSREDVRSMIDVLQHRGPDDEGIYLRGGIGLGHRRLSIIDLSPLGHQPMLTSDGRLCIVFNGEIYNFQEQRKDLVAKGHSFRSQTDTEVVLNAYREYGLDCLDHLRGMFAFAIWDDAKGTLFIARDRLGKKPLYFSSDGRRLAFASEIRALLQLEWVSRDLNLRAIDTYFALQYIPGPMTAYRSVAKLPPGHFLLAEQRGERLRIERYWSPQTCEGERDDSLNAVEALIRQAIRLRLIADVDVGVLLSGGLDSSLITAIAARESGKKLKTFSVGFRQDRMNELPYANRVARQYGTDHHAIVADDVTPEILHRVIDHMDEPLADPACVPTFMIAELASQHVKVVMSGEGADELFGGYGYYIWENLFGAIRMVPGPIRRWLGRALTAPIMAGSVVFSDRLGKILESKTEASVARWVTVFGDRDRRRYLSRDFQSATEGSDPLEPIYGVFARCTTSDPVSRGLEVDLQTWLPDDLLTKVDRMTMACSLEARTPFLDHRLVEWVHTIRLGGKICGTRTKVVLKRLAARYLPPEITERPKHGFEVPVRSWLLENLREVAEDRFSERGLRQIDVLNADAVRQDWKAFSKGATHVSARKIWLLFCFLLWERQRHATSARPPVRRTAGRLHESVG